MHKLNMDKKKKNEDDKEVIDFMELVEENMSIIENDTIVGENELLENKPLQSNDEEGSKKKNISQSASLLEVITEEVFQDLKEIVDRNFEKEINEIEGDNKDLQFLNKRIEKMAMEFESSDNHSIISVSNETLKKENDIHIIEPLKNESSLHIKNQEVNLHSNSINFKNGKTSQDRNISFRKNNYLDLKTNTSNLRFKKYPGYLYIDIYSIEKYISSDTEVKSVFIKLETKDFVYETDDYSEDSTIKFNSLLYLNIKDSDAFNLRFILNKRTDKGIIKSSECLVKIDKDFLNKVHNILFEVNYEWTPYSSNNFFKSIIGFFTNEMADAWGLKLFFSFVSEEEMKLLNIFPSTLYDLGRWLKIRKYAYNTWFTGFCNIRGLNTNICTHLWKRRFIKVYGYKIFIYNELNKTLLGVFDLLSTMSKERCLYEEDNKFRIINNERMIEFHLESTEKYTQFKKDTTNVKKGKISKTRKSDKESILNFIREVYNTTQDYNLKYDLSKCIEIIEGKENQEMKDLKVVLEEVIQENEELVEEKTQLYLELRKMKDLENMNE